MATSTQILLAELERLMGGALPNDGYGGVLLTNGPIADSGEYVADVTTRVEYVDGEWVETQDIVYRRVPGSSDQDELEVDHWATLVEGAEDWSENWGIILGPEIATIEGWVEAVGDWYWEEIIDAPLGYNDGIPSEPPMGFAEFNDYIFMTHEIDFWGDFFFGGTDDETPPPAEQPSEPDEPDQVSVRGFVIGSGPTARIIHMARGTEGDDIIAGATIAYGAGGNDLIIGTAYSDILSGGDGDDVLVGGRGADIISGGSGVDTVDYSASAAGINGEGIKLNLSTGEGSRGDAYGDRLLDIENVVGSAFDDFIKVGGETSAGFDGADYLARNPDVAAYKEANNLPDEWVYLHWRDVGRFEGRSGGWHGTSRGAGADWGTTFDLAGYLAANPDVTAYKEANNLSDAWVYGHWMEAGRHEGRAGALKVSGAVIDAGGGFDVVGGGLYSDYIMGGGGSDALYGYAGHDVLLGGVGNDSLYGGDGNDQVFGGLGSDSMEGGDGRDSMEGGEGNDTILGHDGNDVMRGQAGDDYLHAGAGDDTLEGGDGNDFLVGLDGSDRVFGGNGSDVLYGQEGSDLLQGDAGDDVLYAGGGDDQVFGGLGSDSLEGGDGHDSMEGGEGNDTILGHDGNDVMRGQAGDDYLHAGAGDDTLEGGDGNDFLVGLDGSDRVFGGNGSDVLYGQDGNDVLQGGAGHDVLYGGAGRDTFVFDVATDRDAQAYSYIPVVVDRIMDLEVGDALRLDGAGAVTFARQQSLTPSGWSYQTTVLVDNKYQIVLENYGRNLYWDAASHTLFAY